jgi:hypothetical protein
MCASCRESQRQNLTFPPRPALELRQRLRPHRCLPMTISTVSLFTSDKHQSESMSVRAGVCMWTAFLNCLEAAAHAEVLVIVQRASKLGRQSLGFKLQKDTSLCRVGSSVCDSSAPGLLFLVSIFGTSNSHLNMLSTEMSLRAKKLFCSDSDHRMLQCSI